MGLYFRNLDINFKLFLKLIWLSILLVTILSCKTNTNNYKSPENIKDTLIKGFSFVKVPKGKFTYGVYDKTLTIDYDFWIMKYEVTNKEYFGFLESNLFTDTSLKVVGDTLKYWYKGDSLRLARWYTAKIFDDRIWFEGNKLKIDTNFFNHPVIHLTWFGCVAFCNYYSFDLPTQFEWEKAARGNSGYNYPWGDTIYPNIANYHNNGDPFGNNTTPVGFFDGSIHDGYQTKNNASPYGCFDMAGNAWEYTNSTIFPHLPYLEGGGGGFLYHTGAMTQSWYRSYFGYPIPAIPDRPFFSDGFRCILKK